jgi:uncharacterized protein (DUF58 family)
MTATRSPAAVLYPGAAASVLLLAVVAGRPALIALAAPFLVVAAAMAVTSRPPEVRASARLSMVRAVEGDLLDLAVTVEPGARLAWVTVTPDLPDGLERADGPPAAAVRIGRGRAVTVTFRVRARRWGAYASVPVGVVGRDRLGTWTVRARPTTTGVLRVHPTTSRLRRLVPPRRTRAGVGSHVSRHLGQGFELAEVRPFVPGDTSRSINWRATARRGDLWVTDRHPERASDIVVFLDSFGPAGPGRDVTLGLAVEAISALTEQHLAAGDRVGLVDLGGVLRWLPPAVGARQLHQVTESLLASQIVETFAEKGVDVLPTHAFPPGAVVLAFTPLTDRRAVATLLDLRSRGFDVVIVECRTDEQAPPGRDDIARLAMRLWALEREAIRDRFRHLGVVVVPWTRGQPLAPVLDEVIGLRRRPHRAGIA